MTNVGTWFVEVVPSFKGAAAKMQAESVPIAAEAGTKAGSSFSSAFAKSTKEGAAAASAATISSVKAAEAAVSAASARVVAARAREEAAAGRVKVAEQALAESRAKYGAESTRTLAAEERLAAAQRATTTAAAGSEAAASRLVAAKARLAQVNQAESQAFKNVQGIIGQNSSALGGLIDQTKKYGAAVTAAITVGLGVVAVKAAGDFQSSQERLVTTAGELQANLGLVDQGVLKMAGDVGYSAQKLSVGLYTVESAGYHGAEALKVMQAAAEGAKTENADLTTVTDAVTSAMRDYHLGADQAAGVTSKLVTAVGLGKTTFEQLTGAMSAILPKASAAGVSLEEILGDLSAMTLHGTSAEQASQNLADALTHLASPTLQMTKELAALGLSSADLSKNLGKTGVSGAMLEIEQAVLQHMGPAGTTMLNTFNQSRQAARDAKTMFEGLPPAAQKVAKAVMDGSMSFKEFRKSGGGLAVNQKILVDQWLTMFKSASGFNDILKSGGNDAQTFSQAMAKATGDSASLNVALMLTGENAGIVKDNIKQISGAAAEAGGHVKGWSEVQGTFNQKIDEIKSGMGAWLIEMGTKLLPALTSFLGFLQGIPHWLSENKTWLLLVASVMGALLAPILAVKTATMAWQAATLIMTKVQAAFNLVMKANPVLLLITAIAGLIAGVIYAYTHFQTFRNIVAAVGHALEAAAKAVWAALVAAFNAIVTAVKVVAAAFTWLWQTILKPIFDVISIIVRVLALIILTVLIAPVYLAIKYVLAPVFTWLWQAIIKPIFALIGAIFTWLWVNIAQPAFLGMKILITALAAIVTWLWINVVKPVLNFIGAIINWLYENIIKPIFAAIGVSLHAVGDVFSWLWHNAIEPAWKAIGTAIKTVADKVIHPIFDGIKKGVSLVGDAFNAAVGFIGKVWKGIEDVVKAPVNFVIDIVYNHGIRAVWNAVADFLGLDNLKLPEAKKLAGGGVIGGYSPGHDSVHAMLSPGEAVLVPELVRVIGPANILALNAAYSGRPGTVVGGGYSGGGVVASDWAPMPRFIGGGYVAPKINGRDAGGGSIIDQILGMIGNVGQNVVQIFSNPVGFITNAIGKGGRWLTEVASIPFHFVGKIGEWLWNKLVTLAKKAVAGSVAETFQGAVVDIVRQVFSQFGWGSGPEWDATQWIIGHESGFNPNAQNPTSTAYGLFQFLDSTWAGYGIPKTSNPGLQAVAGARYIGARYGDPIMAKSFWQQHHWYDEGGWLRPGVTATVNATGRPEAVLTASQWALVKASLERNQGGGDTYNITTTDPHSVVNEMERRRHLAMATG